MITKHSTLLTVKLIVVPLSKDTPVNGTHVGIHVRAEGARGAVKEKERERSTVQVSGKTCMSLSLISRARHQDWVDGRHGNKHV